MNRILIWAGLVLAAFLVIGLWVNILTPDRVLGDPIPKATTNGEQSVVTDPTPEPTPKPTRRPTPEPTPVGFDNYLVFLQHTVDFMESFDLDPMLAATEVFDLDALATTSTDLWIVFGNEVDWLSANPPSDCYRAQYNTYRRAIRDYHRAFDLIGDGAIYSDVPSLNQGVSLLTDANRALDRATSRIDSTECGFTGASS